jgi:hypothetical protein
MRDAQDLIITSGRYRHIPTTTSPLISGDSQDPPKKVPPRVKTDEARAKGGDKGKGRAGVKAG